MVVDLGSSPIYIGYRHVVPVRRLGKNCDGFHRPNPSRSNVFHRRNEVRYTSLRPWIDRLSAPETRCRGSENGIKTGEPIRCLKCSYPILYKKRTRRSHVLPLLHQLLRMTPPRSTLPLQGDHIS
ncbi:DNA-directed RNA polymerase [Zostera marina]|uniref:DNA-directed RNA polymerase n=1 Tax=Zostera marina TaxID=29655 RepID=A0A0K9PWC0_ZOSMR|nr:DNA-directed RNA polymerase [Zostera marina]